MTRRVLVVDDEPSILDLLRDVLVVEGYDVDVADTGEAALRLIREHIYGAAILDFNLPDMNGVMLHRHIRQLDAELAGRTMFMSGLVQSEENLDYYAVSGSGFLSKPFQVGEIVRAVHELTDDPIEA